MNWELILVDDRAPDNPWPVISDMAARDHRVRGIRLARNHGQHLAIWAGLAASRGEWVAVIDCDLQDDPSVIPSLHRQAVIDSVDALIVNRGNWSDSRVRRWASMTFYHFLHLLSGIHVKNVGNYGLYSRRMVNTLLRFQEQEVFLPMIVALTGLRTSEFNVDRTAKRYAGVSSYSLLRLTRMAVNIIVRFSDRPLKISIFFGFMISALSACISIMLFLFWLTDAFRVPGWTSVILSVWFVAGILLATIGVHGIYLAHIFKEVKKRPRIIVDAATDSGSGYADTDSQN